MNVAAVYSFNIYCTVFNDMQTLLPAGSAIRQIQPSACPYVVIDFALYYKGINGVNGALMAACNTLRSILSIPHDTYCCMEQRIVHSHPFTMLDNHTVAKGML